MAREIGVDWSRPLIDSSEVREALLQTISAYEEWFHCSDEEREVDSLHLQMKRAVLYLSEQPDRRFQALRCLADIGGAWSVSPYLIREAAIASHLYLFGREEAQQAVKERLDRIVSMIHEATVGLSTGAERWVVARTGLQIEFDQSVYRCLRDSGIGSIEQLCSMTADQLLETPGIKEARLEQILTELAQHGLQMADGRSR